MIFAGEVIFNEKKKITWTQCKPVHNKNFSSDKFQKFKIPNIFFLSPKQHLEEIFGDQSWL